MTSRHALTFEEQDHPGSSEYAIKPFCTCGWAGSWQHADAQDSYSEHDERDLHSAADDSAEAADAEWTEHMRGAKLLAQAATAGLYAQDPEPF